MATSYILRPLCTSHLLYPTPSSEDRVCCCNGLRGRRRAVLRPTLILSCPRDCSLRSDFSLLSVKLTSSTARFSGVILSQGNFTGQANAVADANVSATFSNPLVETQPLLDASSTDSNGSASPSPSPAADSGPDFGPEFDYQVYAANTMIRYEPPPPPRIPFGGPFEDYYDEYVGVDYVPKQEKPTSSFLMFLESLNEKRAEEEAKLREKDPSRPPFNPKPNKHLFEGSKPLFTIPRPIQPAHVPRDYVPPSLDPNVNTTPKRIFSPMPPRKPKPQPQPQPTESTTTTPIDKEDALSQAAARPIQPVGVEEFSPTGTADQPSTSVGSLSSSSDGRPLASDGSPSPPPLGSAFSTPATHTEEPSFGGRTLSPQLRSTGDSSDARVLSPSTRPFEETSSKPLFPSTRPFEAPADASGSLFPQTRPASSDSRLVTNEPTSSTSKPIEESRPLDEGKGEKPFIFQRSSTEASRPPGPSYPMISSPGRPSNVINGSGTSAFPQTRPFESSATFSPGQPAAEPLSTAMAASPSIPLNRNVESNQGLSRQAFGMIHDGPGQLVRTSEYYEPQEGDIVLGVVTYADEDELSLEIGGRVPAIMTMRDFQPFTEIGADSFFKIPDDDSSENVEGSEALPQGKVLLVEDKAANDGIYRGENVNMGTIVVAEVQSRALVEGRPVLTCRRLARSLAFVRVEQIMRTGEPIQMEINQSNDGGLQGYVEGVRAFLPRSELLRRPESSAALQDYIGKTLRVAILQAEEYSSNVIISEAKLWMSENLLLGTVHDLVITRLYPYGMQVEVIGTRIRGFIHISSISRGYVTSLATFFTEGEQIKGMVIKGKKPGQLSFSIEALEPPNEEGLVLRDKETVYYGAEEIAKSSYEYQLPLEERRVFAMPTAATSVTLRSGIANLPWLQLENLRNSS
ncbi:hypothetical protein GOP47_0020158 [Adiantum capillus-veneris]|uniref:S1 motif domain-containing protein n=1 Tax=Adiantum capillus-veneris TaxID=13818 RepID=A0A9D4UDE4_ADICA|nr:hypothetical protein GOP47_0020158 [Adiantum capillus-veneris]